MPRPVKDDIQTVNIPLFGPPRARSTNSAKDQRFVNGYFDVITTPETGKKWYRFVKRPGLLSNFSTTSGTGRGIWTGPTGTIYSVVGSGLYAAGTSLGSISNSSGFVGFSYMYNGSASVQGPYINNGAHLYNMAASVVGSIPANAGDLVHMNGYLFTLVSNGLIYNCDVFDASTWDSDAWIYVSNDNGTQMALARWKNYIVYFSNKSITFLFDNANATGSPLLPYEQLETPVGLVSKNSLAWDGDGLTWVGSDSKGNLSLYHIGQNMTPDDIGDPVINRFLAEESTNITTCRGKLMMIGGKQCYVLDLLGANRTFVYDFSIKIWTEWQAAGATTRFPIFASTYDKTNDLTLCQHESSGDVFTLSSTTYQDNNSNFTMLARTGRTDFDTTNWKYVKDVELLGDQQASTTPVSLTYYDDDYITSSTARTLDQVYTRPIASTLGKFRRRAWQLSYAGANPCAWEALQVKYRLGQD